MRLIQYIKLDRDDTVTKCCKVFGYIATCLGFVIVFLCPLVCDTVTGPKMLLYAVCFSGYLADLLWMRHNLKPQLSEEVKFYLDMSRRFKDAIRRLK